MVFEGFENKRICSGKQIFWKVLPENEVRSQKIFCVDRAKRDLLVLRSEIEHNCVKVRQIFNGSFVNFTSAVYNPCLEHVLLLSKYNEKSTSERCPVRRGNCATFDLTTRPTVTHGTNSQEQQAPTAL